MKLLPCPFCGESAHEDRYQDPEDEWRYVVGCDVCDVWFDEPNGWNRRANEANLFMVCMGLLAKFDEAEINAAIDAVNRTKGGGA